jgi:ornithine carbamoyltransferase
MQRSRHSNLLSLRDLSDRDVSWLLSRGAHHASTTSPIEPSLEGHVVGVLFSAPSTRTRAAFSTAALRLGASIVTFGGHDLQTSTGETSADTGRVLAKMIDALVIRTAGDRSEMSALASAGGLAVVNAMSTDEHPTQALSDLSFLLTRFPSLEGLRFVYVGEGNNTATALCLALARQKNVKVEFRTPPGYGLPTAFVREARHAATRTGAKLTERHDLDDLPEHIDAIYTTQWRTTGTEKTDPHWREKFEPFRVTQKLLDEHPGALFMHDLPAHRGEEVVPEVIDGPTSVVFEQAACKMYSAMAVLEWMLLGVRDC